MKKQKKGEENRARRRQNQGLLQQQLAKQHEPLLLLQLKQLPPTPHPLCRQRRNSNLKSNFIYLITTYAPTYYYNNHYNNAQAFLPLSDERVWKRKRKGNLSRRIFFHSLKTADVLLPERVKQQKQSKNTPTKTKSCKPKDLFLTKQVSKLRFSFYSIFFSSSSIFHDDGLSFFYRIMQSLGRKPRNKTLCVSCLNNAYPLHIVRTPNERNTKTETAKIGIAYFIQILTKSLGI